MPETAPHHDLFLAVSLDLNDALRGEVPKVGLKAQLRLRLMADYLAEALVAGAWPPDIAHRPDLRKRVSRGEDSRHRQAAAVREATGHTDFVRISLEWIDALDTLVAEGPTALSTASRASLERMTRDLPRIAEGELRD